MRLAGGVGNGGGQVIFAFGGSHRLILLSVEVLKYFYRVIIIH
jgi:hypothetical protein